MVKVDGLGFKMINHEAIIGSGWKWTDESKIIFKTVSSKYFGPPSFTPPQYLALKVADPLKLTFKASRLPSPTPCSPVQVPPNSRATFVISEESFFSSGYNSSLHGKTKKLLVTNYELLKGISWWRGNFQIEGFVRSRRKS